MAYAAVGSVFVDSLFYVPRHCLWGSAFGLCYVMNYFVSNSIYSSFAVILTKKREQVALH